MNCKQRFTFLHISYENFCQHPRKHLVDIENFLDITLPNNFSRIIRETNSYHNIGGNRLARKKNREVFTNVYYDKKWRQENGSITKLLASLLTWPFNKKWVYGK